MAAGRRIAAASAPVGAVNAEARRRHYLRRGRTLAQVAHWILLDGEAVGFVLWATPRWTVGIGGTHPLAWVELARLWVDPVVQGQTVTDRRGREHALPVASAGIAAARRRLRCDWARSYPLWPVALVGIVAWSDATIHKGTVYAAAGFTSGPLSGRPNPSKTLWRFHGQTSGNPPQDWANRKRRWTWNWPDTRDHRPASPLPLAPGPLSHPSEMLDVDQQRLLEVDR